MAVVLSFSTIVRRLLARTPGERLGAGKVRFWSRQAVGLMAGAILVLGIVSIWFDDPARLTTGLGLVTAGVAFALQRVITAVAGYFVILRGKTFNVGDRIVMGGVRGDVIALSFMQTKILEMGQPPPVDSAEPAMWVHSRQFTGRIVTVSNDKIFDEPIYNYTYHFPYVWEEIRLPVSYRDDRAQAERILLDAARRHAVQQHEIAKGDVAQLERRYGIQIGDVAPRVYWRLTDNWLELAVRFLSPDHGTREIKDAMSREILARLDLAGIGIASATYEITGLPAITVERKNGPA
ncbi:mechanosensitive ion channel family protein [Sphingomonas glaciei]|uniref:Mechanosensitive ion channel family protein n=1 Tax=Sphingomonas glaciei TaxID=2938948 RepID=A0ABY5MUK8_9SPHN|nr:mechanosensitive ion channel domain-containing protein [Sphingomonas glaciei]UUR08127.1 mechanosensitive ion channel family protein [Sphingomonas glaciei]